MKNSQQPEQTETIVAEVQTEPRFRWWWRGIGFGLLIFVMAVGGFEWLFWNKVYAGVSADGVNLAGMSRSEAATELGQKLASYAGQTVMIMHGKTNVPVPLNSISAKYDTNRALDLAYNYGRTGNWQTMVQDQLRAFFGRGTSFAVYSYNDDQLADVIGPIFDAVATPATNASLSFANDQPQVAPAQSGSRLDLGRLTQLVMDRLASISTASITAPVYELPAQMSTNALTKAAGQTGSYVAGPITLNNNGTTQTIDPVTIISWLTPSMVQVGTFLTTHDVIDLYPPVATADLNLNKEKITAYVAGLAAKIDVTAKNAGLSMQGGQLTVTTSAQTGFALDQAAAVRDITAALTKSAADRDVTLTVNTSLADAREDNLASLGITELISEGETYFPGSPSTRLINVRAGAARFNNVLVAPGQVFSFGALLGVVDASTGYVPELVIEGDHEEYQYGGGLCQVSTTAFRAALMAGLPINQRTGHAFAISYYTWPFGVPGVDATIFYPQVDMKFTNDTGHFILIQTTMKGVDLKFDFYGTKTKVGAIRGPEFISGSNNAKLASHTVFYRDVQDLSGNVIKTDTFNTYYAPSTNYPIVKSH